MGEGEDRNADVDLRDFLCPRAACSAWAAGKRAAQRLWKAGKTCCSCHILTAT